MSNETPKTEKGGSWSVLKTALIETLASLVKSAGAWISEKFFSTKKEETCEDHEKVEEVKEEPKEETIALEEAVASEETAEDTKESE